MAAEINANRVKETEKGMAEFIPYTRHVTDSILTTREGDLLTIFKLEGRSHQSADHQTLMNWIQDVNTVFKGVASDHLALWSHMVRRKVTQYPEGDYDSAFASNFDAKYREQFTDADLRVNELYLTVVHRANPEQLLSFLAKFEREKPEAKRERLASSIKKMEELQRTFGESLKRYRPELLTTVERAGHGGRNHVYSQPAEFLAYLINGEYLPQPVTRGHLAETMPQNRVNFARWGNIGEIRGPKSSRYFGAVEIFEYEGRTEPGHLNVFLEAPYDCVLAQSFTALSRYAAKGFFEKHRRQLEDANDASHTQIDEITFAIDRLMAGEFVGGEHHATLTVFGDTPAQVEDLLEKGRSGFFDVGIVPKPVGLAIEAAFWAQLPANWRYRPRPAVITSQNFLSFSSFHNFISGKPTGNPWGEAVTMFKSSGGTPFYFNFHHTDLDSDATGEKVAGHFIVTGMTGQGKTVLVGALMAQADKFRPTVIFFDANRSNEVLVRAMGGKYFPLEMGKRTGWNPLQLDPTPANMIWLKAMLKLLARGEKNEATGDYAYKISHTDEVEIERALDTLMNTLEKPHRRLSILLQSLPNPISDDPDAPATVHARLLKWCEGGEYGWLFDNPTDEIDLTTHRLYGFDYTEFLKKPEIRAPLMMYLVHRTDEARDGRNFIRLIEEFWQPLQEDFFVPMVRNWVKTDRKLNAINGFITQEPADALDTEVGKTVAQQVTTKIFLPNPSADANDYIEGFKLTRAEFELVKSLPVDSRKFVIKQGDTCSVASMQLRNMPIELAVLSGSPERSEFMYEAIADVGDDPEHWVPVFASRVNSKNKEKAQ